MSFIEHVVSANLPARKEPANAHRRTTARRRSVR
jgi:hypothetical protein